MKKRALGKGLNEILGEVEQAYQKNLGSDTEAVVEIRVDEIIPNPYQPRKTFDTHALQELSQSIREYGLLQPIVVYEDNEHYVLIAGERRLRASKMLGMEKIRAIVADIDVTKLREIALIENIQREDLNPIDLARAYEELLQFYGLTHEELADRIQKSRAQISNTLRLLQLQESVQELLIQEKITQGHAKVLVALEKQQQEKLAQSIVGQKLSVRETEKLVQRMKQNPKQERQQLGDLDLQIKQEIEAILKKHQIYFSFANCDTKITISLKNQEQIQHFLELIQ